MRKFFTFFLALAASVGMSYAANGALTGAFTINAGGDKIMFSKGNLQFTRTSTDVDWSTGTFKLADHQYDLIEEVSLSYCTDNYGDKTAVGIFGWGTWGEGKTPNSTSHDITTYTWSTDFKGTLEGIDTWRTLTKDEWVYLLANHNLTFGTVHGVHGLLIAPDGKDFDAKSMDSYDAVTVSDDDWTDMEAAGIVFLPACGQRSKLSADANNRTGGQGEEVLYYSSTPHESQSNKAYNIWYEPGTTDNQLSDDFSSKRQAFGVRLVTAYVAPDPEPEGDGKLTGAFTINESGDQILFSQGNLQYRASTSTLRFAANQYDTIGADNANISDTYTGWIDLFGWGTGNCPTKTSTDDEDYSTFVDWGVNAISNGGNEANLWRTLTIQEWGYLIKTRTNADDLKGQATVADVHGYVLLPDSWNLPAGLSFTASPNDWTTNVYTAEQWTQMEDAGAVFLPAAGYRNPDIVYVGEKGWYWSSDVLTANAAYDFEFTETTSRVFGSRHYFGQPVRLVTAAPKDATAIDNLTTNDQSPIINKIIRDGRLFIIRDGKTYNIMGAQVR